MPVLLRLAAVVVIVTQLAAFTCYNAADQIRHVDGVGYVVLVEQKDLVGVVQGGGFSNDSWYYIFDTEQAARDFIAAFPPNGLAQNRIPGTYRQKVCVCSSNDPVLDKILRPDTAGVEGVQRALDRAVPPLPTGPAPQ